MTNPRHQLAESLQAAIDGSTTTFTYDIVPDPRDLGEVDPSINAVLKIIRSLVKRAPANPAGSFEERYELWLLIPGQDPRENEDTLDDLLAEVIDFLEAIPFLTWSSAERGVSQVDNRQGYKFTLTLTTDRTPE